MMNTQELSLVGTTTPWGNADFAYIYTEDVVSFATPSHGGFRVPNAIVATWPDEFQNQNHYGGMDHKYSWFEEDCEWSIPVLAMPGLAKAISDRNDCGDRTDGLRGHAEMTAKRLYPELWEAYQALTDMDQEHSEMMNTRI